MQSLSAAELISLLAVLLILSAAVSIVYFSVRNGITPMPASAPVRRAVAAEIRRMPGVRKIAEAGSGWGTLGLSIARHCPGVMVLGLENSLVPLKVSQVLLRLLGRVKSASMQDFVSRVSFVKGDLYEYRYDDADVVVCYLYPGAMPRLSYVLEERLKPGSYVVSIFFAFPGWQPIRKALCTDWYRTPIYVYRMPS